MVARCGMRKEVEVTLQSADKRHASLKSVNVHYFQVQLKVQFALNKM